MALRPPDERGVDASMDADNLYREEIITDRKVGTLRMMTPLKSDGTHDAARATLFIGEAQIMTQAGPLPINFEIEATTLADAVAKFGEAGAAGYGTVRAGALENANVDLTQELVDLITEQRNFQANAKAIQTSSDLTQAIIQIRN